MERVETEAELQFALPVRQISLMLLTIILVGVGGYLAFPSVKPVFLANPYLNGLIFGVFVFGILACFWQLSQLVSSVNWIEGFTQNRPGHEMTKAPRLLASMAALLRSRGARIQISATSSRSILDSVGTRIDEARDMTRYIVNLLIFLGLLGTFFGLATTVPAVVETIKSLSPKAGEDSVVIFTRLIGGLEDQLGGMGTAFASSLLGLAGSLVVGLLELFASHGQNRFYRDLEDWLSTITRVGFAGGEGEHGGIEGAGMAAVVEHMVEQMEGMQRLFIQSDEARTTSERHLAGLGAAIQNLNATLANQQGAPADSSVMERLASGQEKLITAIEGQAVGDHVDAESRMRLRSIEAQLVRILHEMIQGRVDTVTDLRADVNTLSKSIQSLTKGTR